MEKLLNDLILEENNLSFEFFNSKIALEIGNYITSKIINNKLDILVDIYAYGKVLYHFSNDNVSPDKENWIVRKRNTVLYFQHSSKYMNIKIGNNQKLLYEKYGLDLKNYCAVAGSFPIYLKNNGLIGAITISGLKPDEDHNLIIEAIKEYMKKC
ncbi:MAG: heme-binding protein [Erysipelotrichaceae bacterium]|nr:heme-binding protein [Erysipelotrichaceae bacterium]